MARMNMPSWVPPPGATPPQRPRRSWRFRWAWIIVPVACLLVAWLLHHVDPVLEWRDVTEFLGVRDEARYTRLAVLGLALIAVVAVLRLIKKNAAS